MWTCSQCGVKREKPETRLPMNGWADDSKMEQRPVPAFSDRRTASVTKQHHRLDSVCQQVSAMIAGYAQRRKFAMVRYDDTERGFCAKFPWFKFHALIEQKVDQFGIKFEYVGKPVTEEEVNPEE